MFVYSCSNVVVHYCKPENSYIFACVLQSNHSFGIVNNLWLFRMLTIIQHSVINKWKSKWRELKCIWFSNIVSSIEFLPAKILLLLLNLDRLYLVFKYLKKSLVFINFFSNYIFIVVFSFTAMYKEII